MTGQGRILADRQTIFRTSGRVELATEQCDLHCAWCAHCRGRGPDVNALERAWAAPPPNAPALRLRGGDPFRYGDLTKWIAWARRRTEMAVCIEGPAATLAATDRDSICTRILAGAPDAVSAVLPTADTERTAELTGKRWEPNRAIDTLRTLAHSGLAIEVVVPVHPTTVGDLAAVVALVAEQLGSEVDITLRRCPSASPGERRPQQQDVASDWTELTELSRAIASLPAILPGGARLQLDPAQGYAACMVSPEARRQDLFPASGRGRTRPLGQICDTCAWSPHCAFRADAGVPLAHSVRPLTSAEAGVLDPSTLAPMTAEPRRFHTDRASIGLPNLLCFAPWTTLSVCEPRYHPVPCALSWVDSDMTAEQIAAVTGTPVEDERERELVTRKELGSLWHVVDNERLSLMDLWNSPLLRLMRREMTGGDKSSRCRTMCRVVMGVEERGVANFQRPDHDFTPAIIANRERLRAEIQAGKNVLTATPLDLMIGVSAHCNISCGFCDGPRGQWGDLSDRRRDEIIAWLPTLMSFGVSGPGEPLMNKNFLALLHHISDTGYPSLYVSLTTNGTLLTPELLVRTHNVPWGSIRVSLNAGSAETWQRMTGKPYFDRIMTNLDALCALRDRRSKSFSITLSLVTGSVQMGDLAKFAKIVDDYRTAIIVEPMYDNLRDLSPWIRPDRLRVLADELQSVADAYTEKNPDIARAFRAVERFARARIESGDFAVMKGH